MGTVACNSVDLPVHARSFMRNSFGGTMSYGRCWVCGCVMSGDSQTVKGKVTCDTCGWVSGKDGSY